MHRSSRLYAELTIWASKVLRPPKRSYTPELQLKPARKVQSRPSKRAAAGITRDGQ
jgi:hypothetical protein